MIVREFRRERRASETLSLLTTYRTGSGSKLAPGFAYLDEGRLVRDALGADDRLPQVV